MRRATRLGAAALAVAAGAVIAPGAASATTFTVNTTADGNDFNTADPFCDADPGTDGEQCTLRAAVQQTNAQPGLDTAVVPAGVYTLDSDNVNHNPGALRIEDELVIEGAGASAAAITQAPAGRIFEVTFGGELDLRGVTVRGGVLAADGAGILNEGTTTLRRSVISGNQGAGGDVDGGGIWSSGILRIEDSTVSDNAAAPGGHGGGIASFNGTLELIRSTLSGNMTTNSGPLDAASGGGIWSSGSIEIDRSTLSGNAVTAARRGTSGGAGGAIYNAVGPLEITSSTLAQNSAPEGANIARGSPGAELTARNSIVAEPGGGESCFVESAPSPTSQGYNLEDADSCGFGSGPGDLVGVPPLLGALADNGGPTRTHVLLAGSPAIDAGSASSGETTDQRGFPRPSDLPSVANAPGGDGSDIGAFELQPPPTQASIPKCKGKTATIVTDSKKTRGTGGNDVIVGRKGKDKINAKGGKDTVCAKGGNDKVKGGGGKDKLFGQGGKDRLNGGPGKDRCRGGPGKDKLKSCEQGSD